MEKIGNSPKKIEKRGHNSYNSRLLTLIFLSFIVFPLFSGCQLISSAVILIHGTDEKPPCPVKMQGKVAVLCWTDPSITYTDSENASAVGAQLNRKIASKLGKKNKITMISQQEVNNRLDNYPDNITGEQDLIEIAKDLEADYLIGVYLMSFDYQKGVGIYQGSASYAVSLIDGKTGELVYENQNNPPYVYPPNRTVSTDVTNDNQFRREYISRLAERIGWEFYPHDRYDMDI